MNEIMFRKHLKRVLSYGIPKDTARDIVQCAMESASNQGVDLYIDYSIDLLYGLGFSKKYKIKHV